MYKKFRQAWLFLLPGLAGLLLFYVIPFVGGIWYSVTDGSFENKFVGLQNYAAVWQNPMFQLGLRNTMELSLICAPTLFLLSFLLSLLLNQIRPAGAFFRSSVLLPYLMPSSAVLIRSETFSQVSMSIPYSLSQIITCRVRIPSVAVNRRSYRIRSSF